MVLKKILEYFLIFIVIILFGVLIGLTGFLLYLIIKSPLNGCEEAYQCFGIIVVPISILFLVIYSSPVVMLLYYFLIDKPKKRLDKKFQIFKKIIAIIGTLILILCITNILFIMYY